MNELILKYKEFLQIRQMQKTYGEYLFVFSKFIDRKNYDLKNITNEIFTEFLKERKYKTESINLHIKALKHFYKFLGIKNEFVEQLKTSKGEKKIKDTISEQEMNKIVNCLITEDAVRGWSGAKLRAVVYVMFYTGIRKMELINLKRENINLETGKIIVRIPNKSKKERTVICIKKLIEVMKIFFEGEQETINAFNVTKFQIEHLIRKINKHVPHKHLTPHSMRHGMAQHFFKKGVSLSTLRDQLGHENIQTTDIYLRTSLDEQEKEIREKLDK